MKNKILLLFIFALGLMASCTDNFEELNTDPKHPTSVPAEYLITNAQIELSDQISSTNVNNNIWKLVAQYWTETTYTDESNWDIVNRTIADYIFRNNYRVLKDLDDARTIVEAEEPVLDADKAVKQNKLYIIDLMQVYIYQRLVDIFGDIPYTEALDYENYTPVYDDAATIYADLIARTEAAFDGFDVAETSFGDADVYYNGDVALWKEFAGALLIKLGITIADYDAVLSKSAVNKGATNTFTSLSAGAYMPYVSSAPYNNPLYDDLVLSGRADFVAANTIVDKMLELNDGRISHYFELVDTIYVGGEYGHSSSSATNSHPCDAVYQPDFPGILLTYDEVLFYLAEAAARGGYTLSLSAEEYFNAAVTQSFLWWGASADDANDYLTENPYASYTNWKEAIGTQGWIAMYTRGLEGYNFFRRLDYPAFNMPPTPPDGVEDIPTRFTYPINEQTLNAANYQSASSAIGGDFMTTKLFWDKF
ncbi:MAG: SusD/RagB family nutrient-binding outer membrane lipoprotein [Bacteroidales bacterium]|nr:SusD/RagB family nutrient-binding outer membrane lipoprotein [Bacteroidales bacterium]